MAEAAEETADDLGEQDDTDQDDNKDDDKNEDQDTDDMVSLDLGEGEDDESDDSERSTDESDEEKELTVEDYQKQVKDFEKKAEKRESHIKDLNKALHAERKSKKDAKAEETETPLTPTQLRELMKEHQEDPDMMFNIVDYMTKQAAKGASTEAINKAEIAGTKKDIDSTLLEQFPDLAKDDSDLRRDVEAIKDRFFIDKSHPLSDFQAIAAYTLINMQQSLKEAKEEGRQEALGVKAEDTRKKKLKEAKLTPKGKITGKLDKAAGLNAAQAETATQIGLTGNARKIYARLLKKNPNRVEVK